MSHYDSARATEQDKLEAEKISRRRIALNALQPALDELRSKLIQSKYSIPEYQYTHMLQKWHELNALTKEYLGD